SRLSRCVQFVPRLGGARKSRHRPGADRRDDRKSPLVAFMGFVHELPGGPIGAAPARLREPGIDLMTDLSPERRNETRRGLWMYPPAAHGVRPGDNDGNSWGRRDASRL